MSQTRRHRKRRASEAHVLAAGPAETTAAATTKEPPKEPARPLPMPDWKWKTFPVYFAFAIGGFLGMYTGVVASVDDSRYFTIVAIFWAVLLGFGFSRFSTRWILSRRWAKQQAAKRKK